MSVSTKLNAIVGYYVSLVVMPNGDLAIIANHNLIQEWTEFKAHGAQLESGFKKVPENERTPRNMTLIGGDGCQINRPMTIEEVLCDLCEQGPWEPPVYCLTEYDKAAQGHLTGATLIAMGQRETNNEGHVCDQEHLWWFPDWQVEDELETLLEQGIVIFSKSA